jgi:adenylate cyclase
MAGSRIRMRIYSVAPDRVQRRLAAIFFADVVGYSLLTHKDELGTLRRLRAVFHEVVGPHAKTHDGRVIRTSGDGILVEFPSAVEALDCAVAIQHTMVVRNSGLPPNERIELRIGINLGDIVSNGDDLHGDGVNVAARIEPLAPPDGICISATLHEHVRAKRAYRFEDSGEHHLKNIAEPVHVYVLGPEAIASLPLDRSADQNKPHLSRWLIAGGLCGAVALLAGAVWGVWPRYVAAEKSSGTPLVSGARAVAGANVTSYRPPDQMEVPRLSIVVLPFSNMSGNPEYEYFSDGLTEDLQTDLSRIPGIFVIASRTASTYKGNTAGIRQVGRELGVRYILNGSVRRVGDNLRINAQLADAQTAFQIWADRFNGEVAHLGTLQDNVTRSIAGALNIALMDAEAQRALRDQPNNPETIDLTMRGWSLINRPASEENTRRARELFESALRLAPDYLSALNGLAQVMLTEWSSRWYTGTSEQHLAEMNRVVEKALSIRPDDALATYYHGYVLKRLQKDLPQALAAFERAIAIDPNLAVAHNYIGQIKVFLGRANEAAAHTLRAIQLSPRDPQLAEWYYQLAVTYIHEQNYELAVDWARRATQANPNVRYPYRILAVALALSGKVDESRVAAADMLRRFPKETITAFRMREPWTDPAYRKGQDSEIRGMRLAGIPE